MDPALRDLVVCGEMLRRELTVAGLGTLSVELERLYWECLDDMCEREGTTIEALAASLAETSEEGGLERSLRLAALSYFRDASALSGGFAFGHEQDLFVHGKPW
jgi:predicted DNA-binding ribbon-helix-helix protein